MHSKLNEHENFYFEASYIARKSPNYGILINSSTDCLYAQLYTAQIWTSQLRRTVETAQCLDGTIEQWKALNELDVVSFR